MNPEQNGALLAKLSLSSPLSRPLGALHLFRELSEAGELLGAIVRGNKFTSGSSTLFQEA